MLGIVAAMLLLRFLKPNALVWAIAWWFGFYLMATRGIDPPVPSSVVSMYMGVVTIILAAFLTSAADRMKETGEAFVAFFVEKRFFWPLVLLLVAVPALVAFNVYSSITSQPQPPVSGRTIHPPPPGTVTFKGRTVDLVAEDNPYRRLETEDPESFTAHVDNGRRVYYQNCVYCHGDNMEGDGPFAHGFDPIPANFQSTTTISMLEESYLFWRIATGAPGLPLESAPWASAMPAWELFLEEEEIWDVILFLYDYTEQRPRAKEVHD